MGFVILFLQLLCLRPCCIFGAFLGPIFAILLFNVVIYVLVIGVIIKHTRNKLDHTEEQTNMKTIFRLLIGIAKLLFIFGLTWLFGALTVTGFGDARASTAFQVLFVICNAFQGFFIFLFFCVLSKDGRESWLVLLSCSRYKPKSLYPLPTKKGSSSPNATQEKFLTSSNGLTDSNLTSSISNKTGYDLGIGDCSKKERYINMPLTGVAEQRKEKPSAVTFNNHPENHETNVSTDQKVDLGSSEVKEKVQVLEKSSNSEENTSPMQVLEKSSNSEENTSPDQWKEDGMELKARVKRFSTKKVYKHHVESVEVDFLDSDSDGSIDTSA